MVDAKKIQKIISERKKAHINDPDIEKKILDSSSECAWRR